MTAHGGRTVTRRPTDIADGLPTDPPPGAPPAAPGWGDQGVAAIYGTHFGSLVRQAAQLVRDMPTAEDVVQDCFIAMHLTCPRLEDGAKALPYLRQSVVNRSRSVLRHRVVADKHGPAPGPDMPSAEDSALTRLEHAAVISALTILAPRQRQVLALRYFADNVRSAGRGCPGNQQKRGQNTHVPGADIPAASPGIVRVRPAGSCCAPAVSCWPAAAPARLPGARALPMVMWAGWSSSCHSSAPPASAAGCPAGRCGRPRRCMRSRRCTTRP